MRTINIYFFKIFEVKTKIFVFFLFALERTEEIILLLDKRPSSLKFIFIVFLLVVEYGVIELKEDLVFEIGLLYKIEDPK